MKFMVLCGNDKTGRKLLSIIKDTNIILALDKSLSPKRILNLLKRGSIDIPFLLELMRAEALRSDTKPFEAYSIRSNSELFNLINHLEVDVVIMFRVGLIISQKVIQSRAKVINVHCAKIPDYQGLGSIKRALKNQDLDQEATMYFITGKVDDGEIIATKNYRLTPEKRYGENEDCAYDAGMQLILEQLAVWVKQEVLPIPN